MHLYMWLWFWSTKSLEAPKIHIIFLTFILWWVQIRWMTTQRKRVINFVVHVDLFFDQWCASSSITIFFFLLVWLNKISTKLCGRKLDMCLCDYDFLINKESRSTRNSHTPYFSIVVGPSKMNNNPT